MADARTNISPIQKRQRIDQIWAIAAVASLIAAWIIGSQGAKADTLPAIHEAMPLADHFNEITSDLFLAWGDPNEEEFIGYVAIGEGNGYGGPLQMAVAVSPGGEVLSAAVVHHKETPSWMNRVLDSDFVSDLVGKSYSDPFEIGNDVDGVTSATYTSRAIANAALDAARLAAAKEGLPVAEKPNPKIIFGILEITLVALFTIGFIGHKSGFKYKKQARWTSMIVGMVVLGFMYNSPLTLSAINKLLMGFFPQWQTNLYWYILILGIIFVFSVDNKNPYCEWFCPFGAAQECMGAIGGAKTRSPGKFRGFLKWLQRFLAWGAILTALLLRNPGISSFEIFGTLFELIGSFAQFALLGIVLILSLFIRRPWCTYLCPLHPVVEFIRMSRKWILGLWPKRKRTV